jgi:hypothetical protein
MSQKINNITVQVPLKSSGGVIMQRDIEFDVYRSDSHYTLRPCLTEDERRVANLPEELNFTLENGKPVSLRGKIDGNFHVIQDAVKQLKEEGQLA